MVSDDVLASKSRSILRYMGYLFGNPVQFDPVTLEITFSGCREMIKKAVKVLDKKRIWYNISWAHIDGEAYPCRITLQFDEVSLKR